MDLANSKHLLLMRFGFKACILYLANLSGNLSITCARWRSPGSGRGSSHGRERSLGMASRAVRCCCSLNSLRSFDNADCVIAALCNAQHVDLSPLLCLKGCQSAPNGRVVL